MLIYIYLLIPFNSFRFKAINFLLVSINKLLWGISWDSYNHLLKIWYWYCLGILKTWKTISNNSINTTWVTKTFITGRFLNIIFSFISKRNCERQCPDFSALKPPISICLSSHLLYRSTHYFNWSMKYL